MEKNMEHDMAAGAYTTFENCSTGDSCTISTGMPGAVKVVK